MLGEYLALKGGPSLLINTPKHFVFKFNSTGDTRFLLKISKKKTHPAFLLLENYKKQLNSTEVSEFNKFFLLWSFKDPYQGEGGFGCSGAEFLAVYVVINLHKIFSKENSITKTQFVRKWESFLNSEKKDCNAFYEFKKLTSLGSGFDILSQLFGSMVFLQNSCEDLLLQTSNLESSKNIQHKEFSWSFTEHKFAILKSTDKIETYKHLAELSMLKLEAAAKKLKPIVKKALISFKTSNIEAFLPLVNEQQKILEKEELVCLSSVNSVKELNKIEEVLASKSCGALGADTFLIFYSRLNEKRIKEKIKTSESLFSLLWMKDNYLSTGLKLQIKDR